MNWRREKNFTKTSRKQSYKQDLSGSRPYRFELNLKTLMPYFVEYLWDTSGKGSRRISGGIYNQVSANNTAQNLGTYFKQKSLFQLTAILSLDQEKINIDNYSLMVTKILYRFFFYGYSKIYVPSFMVLQGSVLFINCLRMCL